MSTLKKICYLSVGLFFCVASAFAQSTVIWKIGESDNTPEGMALAPDQFSRFVEDDFGYEDRFFLIGHSNPQTEWPYVLPGPANGWGGTGNTAGIRSHMLTVKFEIESKPATGSWQLLIDVLGIDSATAPLLKVMVNGKPWLFKLDQGKSGKNPVGPFGPASEQLVKVDIPANIIRTGTNDVTITSLQGGWLAFDQIRLDGPAGVKLAKPGNALVENGMAADYEIEQSGGRIQPLLIDVVQLTAKPMLTVKLDGKMILTQSLDTGKYVLQAPMLAVTQRKASQYAVFLDNKLVREGSVDRREQSLRTPAGYVNTMMGAGHSRWMIAPGPWMPFGMVKLSPDNQNAGWQAGYDPTFESIGTFSHIHEWTMSGLGTFPVTGPLKLNSAPRTGPATGTGPKSTRPPKKRGWEPTGST